MFDRILRASLAHRLFVLLAAVVLMAAGTFTLGRMPVDVFPDLNKPTVTLQAEVGGMAPEEVEQLITFPLETAMGGLPGVEAVRSVSSVGLAFVYVTFDWSTDIYRARQLVSERLAVVREQFPPGVQHVGMGPVSSVMGEIMLLALPIDPQKISPMAVREVADFVIRPRLLTLPGVAQVVPIGGDVRQYQVQPDTAKLAALGVTLEQVSSALQGFSANTSGGFLELNAREYLIRNIGRTTRLEDLQRLPVAWKGEAGRQRAIQLSQVAEVAFAPAIRRGDAGFNGQPAVVLGVQKQPAADTVALTRRIEAALQEMQPGLPAGMGTPVVTMRQASFIEASVGTLQGKLTTAAVVVAVVLYFFMQNLRTTAISLVAIPLSLLATVLVFRWLGLSINTMTLGGLTIALGELVDDAVVGVENIVRRMKEARQKAGAHGEKPTVGDTLALVARATLEVRSGIVYATAITVLVLLPLFFLPGIEGRLMQPLAVAYIVSLLASMVVSVTVTPVLAAWWLPGLKNLDHGDTRVQAWVKARYAGLLAGVLRRPAGWVAAAGVAVVVAAATVPLFPTTFLPPFNEGTALVGLRLDPGTTLAESSRIGALAEQAVRGVPEVVHVGRRSGRAELDEHAEGVHVSELDVKLKRSDRSLDAVYADIRARIAPLPGAKGIGQPIGHRIDHMLSGVRSQIAIKLFGDDLDTLRGQAEALRARLAGIPGIADLEVEKQVLTPQIQVRVDYDRALGYGIAPGQLLRELQMLVDGERVTQVVEGARRFWLVLRLRESSRGMEGLKGLVIDTPGGRIPLTQLASFEETDGPNQISRDDGRRRIVVSANVQGRALSSVVEDIRATLAQTSLPAGYFVTLGGQFQAQEEASRLIGLLSLGSVALIFLILYARYRSAVLAGIVMANIPLALVGAVAGLWLSGQPLSVAALVGFITLAGIAVRNGILKVSHYANLCATEGEAFGTPMLLRGSLERLTPVLMTALVAALALAPLLFEAEMPGTEILYPVAVVIFSGLVTSTLLDAFVTPAMVRLWGQKPVEALARSGAAESF
ncbi:efflux RND transporter permease subunit [Xylophilus sp. Leaf220]|uniref:efflux RND transporter permease subunit n=1 Tax=Xylophilus sp. Leaf220 TaxID=1735686 RepID=UPI0006FA9DF4|nr:efflux RND transporter permease subunit [Xylophilus sp. Leaf220]KQM75617.1 multidrug transporter AcrB [Xylophilus sp. Leaf220]